MPLTWIIYIFPTHHFGVPKCSFQCLDFLDMQNNINIILLKIYIIRSKKWNYLRKTHHLGVFKCNFQCPDFFYWIFCFPHPFRLFTSLHWVKLSLNSHECRRRRGWGFVKGSLNKERIKNKNYFTFFIVHSFMLTPIK